MHARQITLERLYLQPRNSLSGLHIFLFPRLMSECPVMRDGYALTKHWEYGERLERKRKKKISWILTSVRKIAKRHGKDLHHAAGSDTRIYADPSLTEESYFLHRVLGSGLYQLLNSASGKPKNWCGAANEQYDYFDRLWENSPHADYNGRENGISHNTLRSKRLAVTIPFLLKMLPAGAGKMSKQEHGVAELICRQAANATCMVRRPENFRPT